MGLLLTEINERTAESGVRSDCTHVQVGLPLLASGNDSLVTNGRTMVRSEGSLASNLKGFENLSVSLSLSFSLSLSLSVCVSLSLCLSLLSLSLQKYCEDKGENVLC